MDNLARLPLTWYHTLFVHVLVCYVPHLFLRIPAIHAKFAKAAGDKKPRAYDIRLPRASQAEAADDTPEGRYIARLSGHHQNSFEAFPLIAGACLVALQRGVPEASVSAWAALILLVRLAYSALYIGGSVAWMAFARAGVWAVGFALCCWLMAFAA
jgi:uncharacterized MAPEG superfamily protein